MSLFNKIRFKIINLLVGDSTYIRNATFDWNEKYVAVHKVCYWSNTNTNGDPSLLIDNYKIKLSQSNLIEKV